MKYYRESILGRNIGKVTFDKDEIKNSNDYYNILRIMEGPTGNCQLSSLCFSYQLLKLKSIDPFIEIWKTSSMRKQLLLDVEFNIVDDILKLFNDKINVILNSNYENSNGTKMTLLIIKLK